MSDETFEPREAFIFLAQWKELVDVYPPEQRLFIYEALIDYITLGAEPDQARLTPAIVDTLNAILTQFTDSDIMMPELQKYKPSDLAILTEHDFREFMTKANIIDVQPVDDFSVTEPAGAKAGAKPARAKRSCRKGKKPADAEEAEAVAKPAGAKPSCRSKATKPNDAVADADDTAAGAKPVAAKRSSRKAAKTADAEADAKPARSRKTTKKEDLN